MRMQGKQGKHIAHAPFISSSIFSIIVQFKAAWRARGTVHRSSSQEKYHFGTDSSGNRVLRKKHQEHLEVWARESGLPSYRQRSVNSAAGRLIFSAIPASSSNDRGTSSIFLFFSNYQLLSRFSIMWPPSRENDKFNISMI